MAIFEDDQAVRQVIAVNLDLSGHTVTHEAHNMDEASRIIESLAEDEIDVAVVDGNLTAGEVSGFEGASIARLLRNRFKERVIVIGIAGSGKVKGADINLPKESAHQVGSFVTAIERPS